MHKHYISQSDAQTVVRPDGYVPLADCWLAKLAHVYQLLAGVERCLGRCPEREVQFVTSRWQGSKKTLHPPHHCTKLVKWIISITSATSMHKTRIGACVWEHAQSARGLASESGPLWRERGLTELQTPSSMDLGLGVVWVEVRFDSSHGVVM